MTTPKSKFYSPPEDFLQQGDIFQVDVVTPLADRRQRIFRTSDGRHGSAAFEGTTSARIFGRSDLDQLLSSTADRTPLHTSPFVRTPDGQPELVVIHANLIQYFVVATQTCDISAQDKNAIPYAIILPVMTLAEICRSQSVRFRGNGDRDAFLTIHEYCTSLTGFDAVTECTDDVHYAEVLRNAVASCQPGSKLEKENVGRVRNFINNYYGKGFLFPLSADPELRVPECCIDFSAVFTVPVGSLNDLKDRRVARIADPYRDAFAQAFATRISRIATPQPIKPPSLWTMRHQTHDRMGAGIGASTTSTSMALQRAVKGPTPELVATGRTIAAKAPRAIINTMSLSTEYRLKVLEREIAELKRAVLPTKRSGDWIAAVTGSMKDEPEFDEVLALGRAAREADHPDEKRT